MRTLSAVFAPRAPTMPEGLRTVVASPDRALEPGMTAEATFALRKQGRAVVTGMRMRFIFPDGLVCPAGRGKPSGTVPSVAHPVENCTTIQLPAAKPNPGTHATHVAAMSSPLGTES